MHASHQTLSLLAADLAQSLPGAAIRSVFTQERDELLIAFTDRPECLFVSCSPQLPILFLHKSFARAKRNSTDLLVGAIDARITGVHMHTSDRVLTLALSNRLILEVQLFGARSNVLLLDKDRVVIDAFKRSRDIAGSRIDLPASDVYPGLTQLIEKLSGLRGRELSSGPTAPPQGDPLHGASQTVSHATSSRTAQKLALPEITQNAEKPPAKSGSSLDTPAQHLTAETLAGATSIESALPATLPVALKRGLPILPPVILRELLHRAGISPGIALDRMTQQHWSALSVAATEIERDLASPQPRLAVTEAGVPLHFSTIPLTHLDGTKEEFYPDLHDALRELFVRKRSDAAFQQEHQHLRDALRRRIEKAERICDAIRSDRTEMDRAAVYRRYGSLLMEHLGEISKGATAWTQTSEGAVEDIPLVPSLTPVQNAQRYFEKAKSAERSRVMTEDRLRTYGSLLTRARDLLSELDTISSRPALRMFMKQQKDSLRSLGAMESEEDQERAPFRVFVVHGGFEVWAGKSSANNDELTLHHARPEDLWFHARGASGSHVILKVSSAAGEPGKRARQEAASIAAYYSKMRNARIVPVAMTRRKYVHKPKGAPPGTVVIAREEVVMATPAIPKQPTHITKNENADA